MEEEEEGKERGEEPEPDWGRSRLNNENEGVDMLDQGVN